MIDSECIKKIAGEVKIDICRITDSSRLKDRNGWLLERIEKEYITEFEEPSICSRLDPLVTMENCRSIIVVGLSYNVENPIDKAYRLKGRISKSSWGIDYHLVLRDRMEKLVEGLKGLGGFNYQAYVDTGPLIDRELGEKSGLGYFGKNCSIINPEYGSFISIGYILTDLYLQVDNGMENDCGTCDLCIKACPTGALESPYRLNPKKCISYLTQTKDYISEDLRPKMGIKVFGCDTCQLVCPKNKDITMSKHEEFLPKITGGYLDLEELMVISNREFKSKYGHMAGAWRGKTTLKRNAIIGLGNMGDKKNLHILEKELTSDSDMIRHYASWAIENIKKYD